MNDNHAVCATTEWSEEMRDSVVAYGTVHADLGESMLEIGPGPGAATEWLRQEVKQRVALELDQDAAAGLTSRYAGTNVEVVLGDATRIDYLDGRFDSVGCFTMLHHVPTERLQNVILSEALRLLRPGGVLVGSDSLPSNGLHAFHAGDTYNPIDPGSFIARLRAIGFGRLTVAVDDHILKFVASKPDVANAADECGEERLPSKTS